MAKNEEKLNYSELVRELKAGAPQRIYLLYGQEDYLREMFMGELRALCVPGGGDDFGYHRLDGASLNMRELSEAVNSLPFLSERTLTEVRGFDLNKCRDADAQTLEGILSDIPDFATLALVQSGDYEPDMRLRTVKAIKKYGKAVNFTSQGQGALLPWIRKRFAAAGKAVDSGAASELIYVSGDLMNGLIPEIEKIAAAVPGETVTRADVDKYAHHLPESRVFDMTDRMSERDYDGASRLLSELLSTGEEPIKTLAVIGQQMRRLYAARLAIDRKLGADFVKELCGIKYGFMIDKLMKAARGFTLAQLRRAVELCAETDYAMKSSSVDDGELLRELFIRLSVGESA